MKIIKINILFILAILGYVILNSALFTVKQTETAIVLRFGEPIRVEKEPGLNFKIPMLDNVIFFDKRLLDIELPELEITLGDRRRIIVDAFGRYKITDPLLFYQTVTNEYGLKARLGTIFLGSLRSALGSSSLSDLLSDERIKIMENIKDLVNKSATTLGIEVIDVRIRRTDLPSQNSESVFRQMTSERQREATELRAEGQEQSVMIKSKADKEATIMKSEALKKANILQGEAEAEANKIYADAYSKDKEFFEFYKSMEAYKNSFTNEKQTKFIINPNGTFFKYFKSEQ